MRPLLLAVVAAAAEEEEVFFFLLLLLLLLPLLLSLLLSPPVRSSRTPNTSPTCLNVCVCLGVFSSLLVCVLYACTHTYLPLLSP